MQHKGENKKFKTGRGENPNKSVILKSSHSRLNLIPTGEKSSTKTTFASGYGAQLQEMNFLCQRHILRLLASFHLEHF